jgi:hypothetical protein
MGSYFHNYDLLNSQTKPPTVFNIHLQHFPISDLSIHSCLLTSAIESQLFIKSHDFEYCKTFLLKGLSFQNFHILGCLN